MGWGEIVSASFVWHKPLIPALQKAGGTVFKTSLIYRASSKIARVTQRNPVSKRKKREGGRQREITITNMYLMGKHLKC